jgi:hypothetical protein
MPLRRLIIAAVLALAAPVVAAEPLLAPEQVTVTELPEQDQYYIHGVFEAKADPAQVWKVLSDYEGLKGVLSSLRSSKVMERNEDRR